jgi:hypothetical protein
VKEKGKHLYATELVIYSQVFKAISLFGNPYFQYSFPYIIVFEERELFSFSYFP